MFVPLLYKKRLYFAIALHALTFFSIFLLSVFVTRLFFSNNFYPHPQIFFALFPYWFVAAISTAYRQVIDGIKTKQLLKEKENEELKSELSLLRSQVSPHFMFNVLNSLVSLARKKSDMLEVSLIKLSSLMRYMVYSANEDKVLLQKETEYLQSYIHLQTLRFEDSVDICYEVFNNSTSNLKIEPMLLIPFIENAFKHGTGYIDNPKIIISLKINELNKLELEVQNKYTNLETESKDKSPGIGLMNVTKRLDILYKDKYELLVTKKDCWFITKLSINLI